MTPSAPQRAISALERRLGFTGRRLECLLHFMALAATLAAAKVILSTVGVALFLAKEGPERLPGFYVLLALLAITLSFAFTGVVDRAPRIRLAQAAFFVTLLGAACLRLPVGLDVPGVYHALLASAHVYEIVLDIGPPCVASSATFRLIFVPRFGTSDNLRGQLCHLNPAEYRVAVYIKVANTYWVKPLAAQPLTPMQADGSWATDITTGGNDPLATEIRAYLVSRFYNPPILLGSATIPAALDASAPNADHTSVVTNRFVAARAPSTARDQAGRATAARRAAKPAASIAAL